MKVYVNGGNPGQMRTERYTTTTQNSLDLLPMIYLIKSLICKTLLLITLTVVEPLSPHGIPPKWPHQEPQLLTVMDRSYKRL